MYCCHSILECYNLFSGVKLSIISFCFIILNVVPKCADNGDLIAPNQVSEVDPLRAVSDSGVHFKMFKHNLKAKYKPSGGPYLQIVSGKDLYDQTIIVSVRENDTFHSNDTFSVSLPNIFVDYPLGEMRTTDTKLKHWNTAPLRLQ